MSVKTQRTEGSGTSQLLQTIRSAGYNKDVTIALATVKGVEPLVIRLAGENFDLEEDDIIVARSLRERVITAHITDISTNPAGDHSHSGDSGGSTSTDGSHTHAIDAEATVTLPSPLEVDAKVIVAIHEISAADKEFYVIDIESEAPEGGGG
ncbi:DUF2577 domain-containing protein [Salibacterium salarium]|uniref:DUF2577 domain-containing protein n=1 Tax=Salibacterium salarium TaxID=284579 RepID=A0A3R9QMB5_9BACI|nr:DUF2577 family protein [Salibacterium salarium]RSL28987.1 DUF2577 domain-containing protein [Salibacterium salarium]